LFRPVVDLDALRSARKERNKPLPFFRHGVHDLVGGLFLVYLGVRTLFTHPAKWAASASATGFWGAYLSTFFLTLTNPTTILSFLAIFAGLGVGSTNNSILAALLVVVGVFLGSALWWLLLSGGISLLRQKFAPGWLLWINRLAGCVIVLFGLSALVSLFG
jgi:threonine/homoserine/homoserine lactone efflux protein